MKKYVQVLLLITSSSAMIAAEPKPLFGAADWSPSATEPVGYRGNWTGCYPGATPPLKWPDKNGPFVWKTQVGVGEASPIVVREKVFIVGDGIIVRCLDKATGKIVWERKRHASADSPEEQKMAALEEAVLLFHESRLLREQVGLLKSKLGNPNAKFTEAEKAKINDELAAAQKAYEPAGSKLAEFPVKDYGGISGRAVTYFIGKPGGTGGDAGAERAFGGAVTYSIATPCSDGERLYVYLPTGAVVCYDLSGQRLWFRVLGDRRTSGGWGTQVGPSPALGDGKLIVHYDKVYCFEAKTGKELWAVPNKLLPIASPIIGQRNGVWYVAVGSGEILRLADGQEVFRNGSWGTTVGANLFYDGLFCYVGFAVQLPADANGTPQKFWKLSEPVEAMNHGMSHQGWHGYGSPVRVGDVVYYQVEHLNMTVFEALTGKVLSAHLFADSNIQRMVRGEIYPSLIAAGGFLFSANRMGMAVVYRPKSDHTLELVAENNLGDPKKREGNVLGGKKFVFSGDKLYLHAWDQLLCIGGTK